MPLKIVFLFYTGLSRVCVEQRRQQSSSIVSAAAAAALFFTVLAEEEGFSSCTDGFVLICG